MPLDLDLAPQIRHDVQSALEEDLSPFIATISRERGTASRFAVLAGNDVTAELIPEHEQARATVITHEHTVLCGTLWFEGCFRALDANCEIHWRLREGEVAAAGHTLCELHGEARALLAAERSALNFLQTLSATATETRRYVDAIAGTGAKIMDTRKTLPGLRVAQKYAVAVGGGHNQRLGLFDGILIKENHILAAGGLGAALQQASRIAAPGMTVQIEVENLDQLREALDAGATLILLDNFDLDSVRAAVMLAKGHAELEASGGIDMKTVHAIAETGVDRISIGSLTKDVQAIDLSMRFIG